MDHDVFHHHDGVVDDDADAGGHAPQRHQVEAHPEQLQAHHRDQHRDGDHHRCNESRPPVLQEADQHEHRQPEPDEDALFHAADGIAHQHGVVVEGGDPDIGRERGPQLSEFGVHRVCDGERIAGRLLHHVDEDSGAAVGSDDVIHRLLRADDFSQVFHPHGRAARHIHHQVQDLFGRRQHPVHGGQIQVVVLLNHARALDDVGGADGLHHARQRQVISVEFLRVHQHVELRPPAADDARFGHAGNTVQAGHDPVIGEVPQVGLRPRGRREADAKHGKDREREPVDIEPAPGRQRRRDLGDAALHQVLGVADVDVPGEEHADLGGAARRHRAQQRDAWHDADGLFERPRHRLHLHFHGRDAVIHQDDDPREVRLREDRHRQPEQQDRAGHRQAEHGEEDRPALGFHQAGQRGSHFRPSTTVTSAPSGSP